MERVWTETVCGCEREGYGIENVTVGPCNHTFFCPIWSRYGQRWSASTNISTVLDIPWQRVRRGVSSRGVVVVVVAVVAVIS